MSGIQRFIVSKRIADPGQNIIPYINAIGGDTVNIVGGYKIHTFTSISSTNLIIQYSPNNSLSNAEYLIVAGGGGGGASYYSGGGGAGGYLTGTLSLVSSSYPVTVGQYGSGGLATTNATNGGNSIFSSLTAIGGGYGGGGDMTGFQVGANGGSGGGGAGQGTTYWAGGTGTAGQGKNGGNGENATYRAGGGGGAGTAGITSSSLINTGGDGLQNSISGTSLYYAAGGGGNLYGVSGMTTKKNGIGGASTGNYNYTQDLSIMDATSSTGSGGSGGDRRATGYTRAGNGGSGIVIVRYPYA